MLTEQTDPDRRRRRQTKLELSEFVAAAARDAVSRSRSIPVQYSPEHRVTELSAFVAVNNFAKQSITVKDRRVARSENSGNTAL